MKKSIKIVKTKNPDGTETVEKFEETDDGKGNVTKKHFLNGEE